MNLPGFSTEALARVNSLLYAEGQANPLEGKCGQKQLKEQNKTQRTPAQEQADNRRAQTNRGRDNMNSATRSAAAKKAAETRKKCKGGGSAPGPATTVA